ncbi:MAG: DUF3298 domain-containing protein [Bacteroidetes bacterium]|nr:DUF3298 domain-containing protein [Bacteroidota bacterium]
MKNLLIVIIFSVMVVSSFAQQMNVTYKYSEQKNRELNYTAEVTYPQVDFGPDALMGVRGIASDINNLIESRIGIYIKGFEDQLKLIKTDDPEKRMRTLKITSESSVSGGTLLSVRFTLFMNIPGMAHPVTHDSSFNYSVTSSGELDLRDLFNENADYLTYVSSYSQKELEANAYSQGNENVFDMIKFGTSPEPKNFRVWNISNDSLSITFNPAQAAPYYFGMQTVKIPLDGMLGIIDRKGPLEYLFR